MRYGYGIIRELETGTSFLMEERGIPSMRELIGIAQPNPITDFMALSPLKQVSQADSNLCTGCGNCARCPYLAITMVDGRPVTDASKCIGCSICALKCFVGAIEMRPRTPEELAALRES